jgi:uncharacterized OsmC-like protein
MQPQPAPGAPIDHTFDLSLEKQRDYQFLIDFGIAGVSPLLADEPPPLGEGVGPGPSRLLGAALGNCLAVSLQFCLERARIPVNGMTVRVHGIVARNDAGRLRIPRVEVHLEPRVAEEDIPRLQRCIDVFEDYCTVSASVRGGIDVAVTVEPVAG